MKISTDDKVVFTSPDENDRVVIKKAVISALTNPSTINCPKINFSEAILKEPPMQFSIPKEYVERLRKAYKESQEKQQK